MWVGELVGGGLRSPFFGDSDRLLFPRTGVRSRLTAKRYPVNHRFVASLNSYLTRHIKRYGDYVVNLQNITQPFEAAIHLPPQIFET